LGLRGGLRRGERDRERVRSGCGCGLGSLSAAGGGEGEGIVGKFGVVLRWGVLGCVAENDVNHREIVACELIEKLGPLRGMK
jgi:hypothetical protein